MEDSYRVINDLTGQQKFEGTQWECEDWIDEYGCPGDIIEEI